MINVTYLKSEIKKQFPANFPGCKLFDVDLKIKSHYAKPSLIQGKLRFRSNGKTQTLKLRGSLSTHARGQIISDYMRFLHLNFFKSGNILVPRILFKAKDFFIYEEVEGETFYDLVERKKILKELISPIFKKAAIFLSHLHQIEPPFLLSEMTTKQRFEQLKIYKENYKTQGISDNKYMDLFNDFLEFWPLLENTHRQILHGDFHPVNMILSPDCETLTVIDFTSICLGDPAYDIGTFLSYSDLMLDYHFGKEFAKEQLKNFATFYSNPSPHIVEKDFEKRILIYQIFNYFHNIDFVVSNVSKNTDEARKTINWIIKKLKNALNELTNVGT